MPSSTPPLSSEQEDTKNSTFKMLGLSPALLTVVKNAGMKDPTPIQNAAIPPLLAGSDAEILAPTGTGKTACYLLPLLAHLQKRKKLVGLIIVPTRELARQVTAMGQTLAPSPSFYPFAVYGGAKDDSAEDDIPPPDVRVIVATPGRLLDLFRSEWLEPTLCRFVVLDEGDRLMAGEFREEMQDILALLPRDRQTVLVSATGSAETMTAAQDFLYKPVRIEPERNIRPSIRQAILFVDRQDKPAAAEALLRRHNDRSTIVFATTRDEVDLLTRHLRKRGLKVVGLHGGLTQPARNASIEAFTKGTATALVATDIAARGLDIEQVGQVINISPPEQPDTYLHRIGRTGRAGRMGWAATLCAADERKTMRKIETALGLKLAVLPVPDVTENKTAKNPADRRRR
ncbi:DEAD/DEAH box helicase [Acetobacter conturbans]|uniref:DEAD/DEAH box helicase n=1 Tax=Acetobacter conturbans TaxID=1737472 RepID=A0ABX0JV13_9PROT|nr:DEAD/DEAH box helicase [Acetobacter conturbans]NHN87346.1 DEAD/DEAH box helicase [Acetobacter conturbans]